MPTLHLLRHAKSSWDDLDLRDHDRPLSARGERAAAAMAAFLRQSGVAPDLVLCSTARRTQDTLTAIRAGLPATVDVKNTRALYEADAGALLDRIRKVDAAVATLMLVGHNPGLEDLAVLLAGDGGDPAARKALFRKFPTGALASLSSDGDWKSLAPGGARLTGFVTPKDLM